ncbi:calpain-B-like isoform X1 [Montipora capricornis]|uniref:calpain-B-like isoform X1 n=1 Tax=Montipora capricornis TaxID=246305 RepID=UPI0035F14DB9
MSLRRAQPQEKYLSLQRELLRKGALYEDRDFPPIFRSLFTKTRPSVTLQWKRPKDICETEPKFFAKGVSRTDIAQGRMLNCWFVAAVASLTDTEELFYAVCPTDQSFDQGSYCGMFRFNFWRFGEWVEVIIDDFLPTHNGKLYYARSSDPNEFWSALLEKAYAKVCGSYEAMGLGRISEALQDFTGGVIEMINLQSPPPDLYKVLTKAHERHSLMGASIETTSKDVQKSLPNGLITGHAYSITSVAKVNLPYFRGIPEAKLIRLRNPHGNSAEWRGPWSDRSDEWNLLSAEERKRLNLVFDDDGEFWMTMEDFQTNFTRIEICMLTADSILEPDERKSWKIRREKGRWQTDASAGGCRNFIDTFHINPQIRIHLQDPDEDDDEDHCSIVVSLMRIDRKRTPANDKPPIGFAIYKVPDDMKDDQNRFDRRFFETTKALVMTNSFTKLREISCRYSLPQGEYVIIPSTFYPRQEAEFLLRIFSEKPHEAREVDVETKITRPPKPTVSSNDAEDIDKNFWKTFQKFAGEDGEIDQYELQEILSQAFVTVMNSNLFSLEACRSMIAMFDRDKTGALGYSEFRGLWTILGMWKETFHAYDKDNSGDMNLYELRDALIHLGYQLSNNALSSIILRYHNKKGTIPFDIFIQILVRVIVMFDTFRRHVIKRGGRSDKAVFTIDDFIESTLTV